MKPLALLGTFLLASVATACTAIVAGKLSDTSDYKTSATPTQPSACDLVEGDANTCSTCIQTNCANEVAYACNNGIQEKKWFSTMQECAKNPQYFDKYDWGCSTYADAEAVAADPGSDTQQEAVAHNCITSNCLQGATPDCKRCDVGIQKSSNETTTANLADDACGSCIVANCYSQLLSCCDVQGPINDFIQYCAYTALSTNKTKCQALANDGDAAAPTFMAYEDAGIQCFDLLSQCFRDNCAATPGCQ